MEFNLAFSYFLSVEFIKFFQGGDQAFLSDSKLDNSEYLVHGDQDKNYSKGPFTLTSMRFSDDMEFSCVELLGSRYLFP